MTAHIVVPVGHRLRMYGVFQRRTQKSTRLSANTL